MRDVLNSNRFEISVRLLFFWFTRQKQVPMAQITQKHATAHVK